MPDLTRETIAELRRLLEAATPGPWGRLHDGPHSSDFLEATARLGLPAESTCDCAQVWSKPADCPVAFCDVSNEELELPRDVQMANAALIAAAISALPALLAAAERGLGAGDGR